MRKIYILLMSLCVTTMAFSLNLKNFFENGSEKFKGGFENAGYKIERKILKRENKVYLVENITDTATTVQKVYELEKDKMILLSQKEADGASLDIVEIPKDMEEVVLKAPIKQGNSWKSKDGIYKIVKIEKDKKEIKKIVVEKKFNRGGKEIITYEKGKGMIKREYKKN